MWANSDEPLARARRILTFNTRKIQDNHRSAEAQRRIGDDEDWGGERRGRRGGGIGHWASGIGPESYEPLARARGPGRAGGSGGPMPPALTAGARLFIVARCPMPDSRSPNGPISPTGVIAGCRDDGTESPDINRKARNMKRGPRVVIRGPRVVIRSLRVTTRSVRLTHNRPCEPTRAFFVSDNGPVARVGGSPTSPCRETGGPLQRGPGASPGSLASRTPHRIPSACKRIPSHCKILRGMGAHRIP